MPIIGVIDSSKSGNLYSASYDSIATTTVGAGGATDITFSSIPSGYTHLQIRGISRTGSVAEFWIRLNNDTGNNYAYHTLRGNGSQALAGAVTSTSRIAALTEVGSATVANTFSPIIIDILDYANSSKNKTIKILTGTEQNNTTDEIGLSSGLWINTSAITSITLFNAGGNSFTQFSQFALYGIKVA